MFLIVGLRNWTAILSVPIKNESQMNQDRTSYVGRLLLIENKTKRTYSVKNMRSK
jgi:hypothetical protein